MEQTEAIKALRKMNRRHMTRAQQRAMFAKRGGRGYASSWLGAKRLATKEGFNMVYYDFDEGVYGTVPHGQPVGHFDEMGQFIKHKVVYYPTHFSAEKIRHKEFEREEED